MRNILEVQHIRSFIFSFVGRALDNLNPGDEITIKEFSKKNF